MVLLCYDGSLTARHAISAAHTALGHKPATVLHVWQPPTARAEPSHGRVWRTVVDVAEELSAELIVVGARGLSTVRSVLLGSVSNAVAHHSSLPVLIVPRADATHNTRGAS